ncbi:MAG: YraN family protein [Acidobacteria bacterium]|nr:YraN family protein [Acidobacteriota bacterium]
MFAKLKTWLTKPPARSAHLALGERGERAALEYLRTVEGFTIVATNFKVPLGRGLRNQKITGEIDLIAYDNETLVFIEVKTRTSDRYAAPERAVDLRKQRQIARAARRYRQMMKVADEPHRYDVVTVIPQPQGNKIELLRFYFDDSVFLRGSYFNREP